MIPTDREFASVLSGGVDSSLLSAYAVEFGNPKTLVAVNHIGKEQISHDLIAFEKILNKKTFHARFNEMKKYEEIKDLL